MSKEEFEEKLMELGVFLRGEEQGAGDRGLRVGVRK